MTTFSDVIERTRRRLLTNMRPGINVLTAGLNTSETALTFNHEVKFSEGARLSIDLEDMHVTSTTTTGCSVVRAMDGSTAATHSAGAVVRVNPPWTNFEIANAVNAELDSLSGAGLFRVRSIELTYNASTAGYNLVGVDDFISVWRVQYFVPGPEKHWPVINPRDWRVDQNAETDDFATGTAIILASGGYPGQQVRVNYRAAFDRLSAVGDDVEAVSGLHAQAHSLLDMGAAIRLMSGEDVKRALSVAQANPRRADEVPPSTGARAIEPLARQYERDLAREVNRLTKRYPVAL